jgi:SAM-dependent MidA family methyltransferase
MQPGHEQAPELPAPDDDSARHSEQVAHHIRRLIAESGGDISFAEFMQHALYAPGLGYYSAGSQKFGASGDFVTAPEISPIFGNLLATQCAHILEQIPHGRLFELGAGSGALAVAILQRLDDLDRLPDKYFILEVSADLKQRQEARLRNEVPQIVDRVAWLSDLPQDFAGVIVANEVADALPVERFLKKDGMFHQWRVAAQNDDFVWRYQPARGTLRDALGQIEEQIGRPFADGYQSELSLGLAGWIQDLAQSLKQGFVFLFDYGVSRREFYAAERDNGWLRCHFRHRVHDNPLLLPGIQDLTTWVDFTAVAEAASRAGLSIAGFVSQAHFLLNAGIDKELAGFTSLPVQQQVELSRQVKLLTLPAEMGENFKCLGLSRGKIVTPPAFAIADRQYAL